MANFHVQGLDVIVKGLEELGETSGEMAEDMLRAGAVVLIGTWNQVIIARGHVKTGAMLKNVKAGKIKRNKDGDLEVQVYPQGTDKNGTRNVEKAFLLHYGWKSNAATKGPWVGDHFVNEIEETGTPKAIEAMEFIMSKHIERSGL